MRLGSAHPPMARLVLPSVNDDIHFKKTSQLKEEEEVLILGRSPVATKLLGLMRIFDPHPRSIIYYDNDKEEEESSLQPSNEIRWLFFSERLGLDTWIVVVGG